MNNREYAFLDAEQGCCFVPSRRDAEALLAQENHNYTVAWERYGVEFDEQGNEVEADEPVGAEAAEVPRKRGRPRKS